MKGHAGKRTAIYARVSTEEQAEHGTSLDGQVEECRRRARDLGFADPEPYVDAGISGTQLDRPALDALRADIALGEFQHLLCYDPDRLSRNLGHLLLLMDEFTRAGVQVEFTNFDLHPTADGRLLFAMRGAIAEFETHKIRQRMTAGKMARAREGKPVGGGHQIYGYRYDKILKRFDVEPSEASVVELLFRLAEEMGTWEIAKTLNARAIPAKRGGRWSQASVLGILHNRTYLGEMPQMKGAGHVPVPSLIDADTFQRVQGRLSARYNRPPGPARHPYLLRGFLECGQCGRPMGGGYGHRVGDTYVPRYACAGKRLHPSCPSSYLRADRADQAVWQAIISRFESGSTIHRAAGAIAAELARERRRTASRRTDPDAQLQALALRRQRLIRAYRDGIMDESALRDQIVELDGALHLIEEERTIRLRQGTEDLVAWCLSKTEAFVRMLRDGPSLEDRRIVLSSLGARVVLQSAPTVSLEVQLTPAGAV